jgi:hypothetical protein
VSDCSFVHVAGAPPRQVPVYAAVLSVEDVARKTLSARGFGLVDLWRPPVSARRSNPAATRFNIGAIYGFDTHNHLLILLGAGLQNSSTANLFS